MAASPMLWGPTYWFVLHHAAKQNPNDFDVFLENFVDILPCPGCTKHAKKFLAQMPFRLDGNEAFSYTCLFHNTVNERQKKLVLSLEEAHADYETQKNKLINEGTLDEAIFSVLYYSSNMYFVTQKQSSYRQLLQLFMHTFYPSHVQETIPLIMTYKCVTMRHLHDLLQILFCSVTGKIIQMQKAVSRQIPSPSFAPQIQSNYETKLFYHQQIKDIKSSQKQLNNHDTMTVILIILSTLLIMLQIYIIMHK